MTPRKAVACQNKTENIKPDFFAAPLLGVCFSKAFLARRSMRSVGLSFLTGMQLEILRARQLLIRRCHSVCSVG